MDSSVEQLKLFTSQLAIEQKTGWSVYLKGKYQGEMTSIF